MSIKYVCKYTNLILKLLKIIGAWKQIFVCLLKFYNHLKIYVFIIQAKRKKVFLVMSPACLLIFFENYLFILMKYKNLLWKEIFFFSAKILLDLSYLHLCVQVLSNIWIFLNFFCEISNFFWRSKLRGQKSQFFK